jgi:hypothetical protein
MTLAECRPGRKVRFDTREGLVLYATRGQTVYKVDYGDDGPGGPPVILRRVPASVTVQYWSPARFAWLTEQFRPEQLEPAPELATDDVPGRPA